MGKPSAQAMPIGHSRMAAARKTTMTDGRERFKFRRIQGEIEPYDIISCRTLQL